ncbi:MAG: hypothetical protein K2J95_11310, partial [Lachnospiraceae bacterium]|nr:hypothetical protein [Lachnospiraceae bacterium]
TKKAGKKKRVIITVTAALVVLLALSALLAVLYHNYTKEICVMEPVEHMGQREGVSMDNILVEMEYSIITEGEYRCNYLYIFENGDVYSGYWIDYYYVHDYYNKECMERSGYYANMDDRYWDYLHEQYYWGKLSPRDLNGIINEFAQVDDFKCYNRKEDDTLEPQLGTLGDPIYDQENNDIYRGHWYRGRMELNGTEDLRWISNGTVEEMIMYLYNEHSHNAIDIVKSTWAYGQWTNQIFGEGWEERIDLKDEMEVIERERSAIQQLALYWKFVWESILSLLRRGEFL